MWRCRDAGRRQYLMAQRYCGHEFHSIKILSDRPDDGIGFGVGMEVSH